MANLLIEIKGKTAYTDGRKWGKVKGDLGQTILNILFYKNKDGMNDYTLLVNGKDETSDFKKQVKEEYQNIPNTSLRDSFFTYANIK